MTKIIIFNGVLWNSHLIMNSGENSYHARFITFSELHVNKYLLFATK